MSLSAILLDVDGTIADTEELHRCAYNYAFKYHGLRWEWHHSLYTKLLTITGGKERIYQFIIHHKPTLPAHLKQHTKNKLISFINEIHQTKTRLYLKLLKNSTIELRSGIKELILEAKSKNIKIGIVTTTSMINVETLLKRFFGEELSIYFDTFCTGDNIKHKKPAPDLYIQALDRLSLHPNECITIEDSRNGLLSSITAKIPTIITVNEYTKNEDFSESILVVDQLGSKSSPAHNIKGDLGVYKYINLKALNFLLSRHLI